MQLQQIQNDQKILKIKSWSNKSALIFELESFSTPFQGRVQSVWDLGLPNPKKATPL